MKLTKKKVILAAVVLVAAGCAASAGYKSMRGLKVSAVAASYGTMEDYYTEEGTLSFGQDYVVVSKVAGPVKEVMINENSLVRKGDVLFTVDDRDLQYEKTLYESNLAGLKAQLEQNRINQVVTTSPQEYLSSVQRELSAREAEYRSAKTVSDASESLYAAGSISKLEWEQNRAAYEASAAAVQQARDRYTESRELLNNLQESGIDESTINGKFYDSAIQQLTAQIQSQETTIAQLEDTMKDCVITADRDGVVTSIPVSNMSMIQAGETAVVISSRDQVQAEAEVLTSVAPYLKQGDAVVITFKLRGQDSTYQGTISQVYDFATKGTSALGLDEYRVQVKTNLDADDSLQGMAGYDVDMKFQLYYGEEKLLIPSSAIFRTDGQDYVYVIQNGTAVKTPVTVEYQASVQSVITEGLSEGQMIISLVDEEGIYDGANVYFE
ncbi:MAG: efflux RND transporter periplasmic adaptor subunit [Lachnospiraceae bacterium]